MNQIIKILFLLFPVIFSAQGINLDLNRVLTLDTIVNGNFTGVSSGWVFYGENYTVPENKVWKIQYMYPFTGIQINDVEVSLIQISGSGSSESTSSISSPIWLDSGDNLRYRFVLPWNGIGSSAYKYEYFISILEFNKQD